MHGKAEISYFTDYNVISIPRIDPDCECPCNGQVMLLFINTEEKNAEYRFRELRINTLLMRPNKRRIFHNIPSKFRDD